MQLPKLDPLEALESTSSRSFIYAVQRLQELREAGKDQNVCMPGADRSLEMQYQELLRAHNEHPVHRYGLDIPQHNVPANVCFFNPRMHIQGLGDGVHTLQHLIPTAHM